MKELEVVWFLLAYNIDKKINFLFNFILNLFFIKYFQKTRLKIRN